MDNIGSERLSGNWGEVWLDGRKILDVTSVKASIKANSEKVHIGIDEESKTTSLTGEFTMKVTRVYTHFTRYIELLKQGKNPRFQIVTALKDPDAIGGQEERYALNSCWLSDVDIINYEKTKLVEQELKGGFPVSKMQLLDEIREV